MNESTQRRIVSVPALLVALSLSAVNGCPDSSQDGVPSTANLTVQITGQGSVAIDPPSGTYSGGTVVTLTATPVEGWSFDHWEGALRTTANPVALTMDADKQVTAVFVIEVPDTFTFNVEWDPHTTLIDDAHKGLVKAVDPANATYTLDAQGVQDAGLDVSVGRILVVYNEGFARIASVQPSGADLIVEVAPARLTDAITNGTIAWDYGVSFKPNRMEAANLPADLVRSSRPMTDPAFAVLGDVFGGGLAVDPQAADAAPWSMKAARSGKVIGENGEIRMSFQLGDYAGEIAGKLLGSSADLEITLTKELTTGVVAKLTAKTTLGAFRSRGSIKIKDREIQEFNPAHDKLQGTANLALVVAGSGTDLRYNRTIPILDVPVAAGPIPILWVKLGVQVVINASVPLDATAKVSADFEYDSDTGLTYKGSKVEAAANVAGHGISTSGEEPYAGGASQMGASFGVGLPHLELAVGHKWVAEAACWFHPAFVIGGSWTTHHTLIPVCMKIDSEFLMAAGWKLSALNELLTIWDGSKTLFDEKKPLRTSGDCPDN